MIINALTFIVIVLVLGLFWHFLFLLTIGEKLLGKTAGFTLLGKRDADGNATGGLQPFKGIDEYPFVISALLAAWVLYSFGLNLMTPIGPIFPSLYRVDNGTLCAVSGVFVALGAVLWERVIIPRWTTT